MLPINFHQTFVPERRHIEKLLHYAALGKQGSMQELAEDTGIPMGKSSGKAPAIVSYAKGMGLIEAGGSRPSKVIEPTLTPFGRAVYLGDRCLEEPLTQWLVHLNLCRGDIGAEAWHAVFAKARNSLGNRFTRPQLEEYLARRFGPGRDRTGPLVRTYTDSAALGGANVLAVREEWVERRAMPVRDDWGPAYAAALLSVLESQFAGREQVTLDEVRETHWFDAAYWSEADIEALCMTLDRCGYLKVDRQLKPWVLDRHAQAAKVWPLVYEYSR